MNRDIHHACTNQVNNRLVWIRHLAACFAIFVVSLASHVIIPAKAAHAADLTIYVSATVDRGPTDALASAQRLANVPFHVYVNGVLTTVKSTTAQAPGGSTSADTFGTATVGDEVIVCLAGEVAGYSFEAIRLNANPVGDPAGLGRPCGGLFSVGATFTAVVVSFNFRTDLLIYVSATVDRGPTDALSSAQRLANVPFQTYVNGELTAFATTTALAPGGSTSADVFGTAKVGDEVIVCLAGEVDGFSFEAIRLNNNPVGDPGGLGRPCGEVFSVGAAATSVPFSFNFRSDVVIYVSATIDRGPTEALSSAQRLANVPFDTYVNGELTLEKATTSQAPGGSTSADTFGFAKVGDEVIVCLANEGAGFAFESIRLNANAVADPAGLGRPCGEVFSVGTAATSVPFSFNFSSYFTVPCREAAAIHDLPQESSIDPVWHLISIPCNTPALATLADLINDRSITDNPDSWAAFVYAYDGSNPRYVALTADSYIPRAGTGVWFISTKSVTLKIPDGSVMAQISAKAPCNFFQPCHVQTIDRETNWSLIGNPFDQITSYNDILLVNDDQTLGCTVFTPCSLAQPIIASALFMYDSTAEEYLEFGIGNDKKSEADTWSGYWAIFEPFDLSNSYDDWQLFHNLF